MAERFSPGLFCVFSLFPRNPWLEEVNRVKRCEKTPRILIGIFLLGLVLTASMVSRSDKEERC